MRDHLSKLDEHFIRAGTKAEEVDSMFSHLSEDRKIKLVQIALDEGDPRDEDDSESYVIERLRSLCRFCNDEVADDWLLCYKDLKSITFIPWVFDSDKFVIEDLMRGSAFYKAVSNSESTRGLVTGCSVSISSSVIYPSDEELKIEVARINSDLLQVGANILDGTTHSDHWPDVGRKIVCGIEKDKLLNIIKAEKSCLNNKQDLGGMYHGLCTLFYVIARHQLKFGEVFFRTMEKLVGGKTNGALDKYDLLNAIAIESSPGISQYCIESIALYKAKLIRLNTEKSRFISTIDSYFRSRLGADVNRLVTDLGQYISNSLEGLLEVQSQKAINKQLSASEVLRSDYLVTTIELGKFKIQKPNTVTFDDKDYSNDLKPAGFRAVWEIALRQRQSVNKPVYLSEEERIAIFGPQGWKKKFKSSSKKEYPKLIEDKILIDCEHEIQGNKKGWFLKVS